MNMRDLILVLNAAEGRVQFVLARQEESGKDVETLCAQDWAAPSRGTEILPSAVRQAFALLERNTQDLDRVVCVNGPGSFTGIRLALSFAAALRRATGARLAPLNYLQVLAASAPALPGLVGPRTVRVLTHARRGLVHGQDFWVEASAETCPAALSQPDMMTVEQAVNTLPPLTGRGPVQLVGSGVTRNLASLMSQLPEGCIPVPSIADQPSLRVLLEQGLLSEAVEQDLEPLYLRPCDAEDNLPHIARQSGQAPEEAQARLDALLARKPVPQAESQTDLF